MAFEDINDNLYERISSYARVGDIVEMFYIEVMQDDRISHFFSRLDLDSVVTRY